jgi:hypothetical protein
MASYSEAGRDLQLPRLRGFVQLGFATDEGLHRPLMASAYAAPQLCDKLTDVAGPRPGQVKRRVRAFAVET